MSSNENSEDESNADSPILGVTKSRRILSDSEDEDDVKPTSNGTAQAPKIELCLSFKKPSNALSNKRSITNYLDQFKHKGQRKKVKRMKRKKDDEGSDEDEYLEDGVKGLVFDSDEEEEYSDEDDVPERISVDKKGVLDFMNDALSVELLLLNSCSEKKAQLIVQQRPYEDWNDLVEKFKNATALNTDLLNEAQRFLNTRSNVEKLMQKCLDLSKKLERAIQAGASRIKTQPETMANDLELAPYQIVGLNWLATLHSQNVSGILADEMGLGKTVQIIAFLTYLKENNFLDEDDGPHLIVVPSSTIENWMNEFERWSPGLSVLKYYGSQDERKQLRFAMNRGDFEDVDVIITTYQLAYNTPEERKLFRTLRIKYVIFDEGHMLKNMNSQRYEHLVRINSNNRILLTGTPLQNNLLELMSLIMFIMPKMFSNRVEDVKSLFTSKVKLSDTDTDKPIFESVQITNAKKIMEPFMLRRLKSEVLKYLPEKSEELIKCPMTEKQENLYKLILEQFSAEARQNNQVDATNVMMRLRKAANHTLLNLDYYTEDKLKVIARKLASEPGYKGKVADYILEDLFWMCDYEIYKMSRLYKSLAGFGIPQDLIPESGKLQVLKKLLSELKAGDHRVLIFSQFIFVLDILQEFLTMNSYRYLRLDGQTPVLERQDMIDEFSKDADIFVFLLSTRAGGLGINLTAADTVIIHDIDFNPHNDKQAEDRSHRVGQTRPVRVIRLLSENTIDEHMYKIAQDKLQLEEKITGTERNKNSDKTNILKLLKSTLGIDHNKTLNLSPQKNGSKSENCDSGEIY